MRIILTIHNPSGSFTADPSGGLRRAIGNFAGAVTLRYSIALPIPTSGWGAQFNAVVEQQLIQGLEWSLAPSGNCLKAAFTAGHAGGQVDIGPRDIVTLWTAYGESGGEFTPRFSGRVANPGSPYRADGQGRRYELLGLDQDWVAHETGEYGLLDSDAKAAFEFYLDTPTGLPNSGPAGHGPAVVDPALLAYTLPGYFTTRYAPVAEVLKSLSTSFANLEIEYGVGADRRPFARLPQPSNLYIAEGIDRSGSVTTEVEWPDLLSGPDDFITAVRWQIAKAGDYGILGSSQRSLPSIMGVEDNLTYLSDSGYTGLDAPKVRALAAPDNVPNLRCPSGLGISSGGAFNKAIEDGVELSGAIGIADFARVILADSRNSYAVMYSQPDTSDPSYQLVWVRLSGIHTAFGNAKNIAAVEVLVNAVGQPGLSGSGSKQYEIGIVSRIGAVFGGAPNYLPIHTSDVSSSLPDVQTIVVYGDAVRDNSSYPLVAADYLELQVRLKSADLFTVNVKFRPLAVNTTLLDAIARQHWRIPNLQSFRATVYGAIYGPQSPISLTRRDGSQPPELQGLPATQFDYAYTAERGLVTTISVGQRVGFDPLDVRSAQDARALERLFSNNNPRRDGRLI
ncbi:hypothetical protein [Meiothermus granaticius]|uniref:Uncharacterized protein n=1 Tax=Meiothermus granaticius NBRC 107808 TaxID=1227551 RepID=A0A399FBK1_9DEIN|nr:hypothetical protein [Meiothermus granaticius]RIH93984.1 hypothetical protein Mgrana_00070 [Meiothermus granaticius NBRC 107808]GEM88187.1 hypothetical protein MGR01S_28120 [Meiothermus granaticius NBRC 107808]